MHESISQNNRASLDVKRFNESYATNINAVNKGLLINSSSCKIVDNFVKTCQNTFPVKDVVKPG